MSQIRFYAKPSCRGALYIFCSISSYTQQEEFSTEIEAIPNWWRDPNVTSKLGRIRFNLYKTELVLQGEGVHYTLADVCQQFLMRSSGTKLFLEEFARLVAHEESMGKKRTTERSLIRKLQRLVGEGGSYGDIYIRDVPPNFMDEFIAAFGRNWKASTRERYVRILDNTFQKFAAMGYYTPFLLRPDFNKAARMVK